MYNIHAGSYSAHVKLIIKNLNAKNALRVARRKNILANKQKTLNNRID